MKKRQMTIMFLVMLSMVFFFGCGNEETSEEQTKIDTAESYINLGKEALMDITSYSGQFLAEIRMASDKESRKINATMDMKMEPLMGSIIVDTSWEGNSQISEIYLEQMGEEVSIFMGYQGEWTEMKHSQKDAIDEIKLYNAPKSMQKILEVGQDWEIIQSTDGVVEIKGMILSSNTYDIVESGAFFELVGMRGIDKSYYENAPALQVIIKLKEDGTPLSFEIELADTLEIVINEVMKQLEGESQQIVDVEIYKIYEEIHTLNTIENIEIPLHAREGINYEEEINFVKGKQTSIE